MAYILKQKFNISDLVEDNQPAKTVVLVEPDYYLQSLYTGHLLADGFGVKSFPGVADSFNFVQVSSPEAALLSPHSEKDLAHFVAVLQNLRQIRPSLPIITIGEALPIAILSKIMSLGAAGHLERRLTRPRDIILVIKTILNN